MIALGRHTDALHATHEVVLGTLDRRLKDLSAVGVDIQKKFRTFDPLTYVGREVGVRMEARHG